MPTITNHPLSAPLLETTAIYELDVLPNSDSLLLPADVWGCVLDSLSIEDAFSLISVHQKNTKRFPFPQDHPLVSLFLEKEVVWVDPKETEAFLKKPLSLCKVLLNFAPFPRCQAPFVQHITAINTPGIILSQKHVYIPVDSAAIKTRCRILGQEFEFLDSIAKRTTQIFCACCFTCLAVVICLKLDYEDDAVQKARLWKQCMTAACSSFGFQSSPSSYDSQEDITCGNRTESGWLNSAQTTKSAILSCERETAEQIYHRTLCICLSAIGISLGGLVWVYLSRIAHKVRRVIENGALTGSFTSPTDHAL